MNIDEIVNTNSFFSQQKTVHFFLDFFRNFLLVVQLLVASFFRFLGSNCAFSFRLLVHSPLGVMSKLNKLKSQRPSSLTSEKNATGNWIQDLIR